MARQKTVNGERWYMYRNPATGAEVKVIVPDHEPKQQRLERKVRQDELLNTGYVLLDTIDPVTVNKGAK
jgi:hypothetical protein